MVVLDPFEPNLNSSSGSPEIIGEAPDSGGTFVDDDILSNCCLTIYFGGELAVPHSPLLANANIIHLYMMFQRGVIFAW